VTRIFLVDRVSLVDWRPVRGRTVWGMTTTLGYTPDSRAVRARRRTGDSRGYANACAGFEQRAQQWLRGRPGRVVYLPEDLAPVAALGVPCRDCGGLIYRDGASGHVIAWAPLPGWAVEGSRPGDLPWAAAVTASCLPA
jgi:hypothetical protein